MQIQVVSEYDNFMTLESTWRNVLEQSRNDVIYLTHEWFRCWWLSYGQGKRLSIILVKDKDDVIGIAPFYRARGFYRNIVPISEIGFCVNGMSPRVDFIVLRDREKDAIRCVFNYLCDGCQSWDILKLNKIHTKSPTYEIIKRVLYEKKLPIRITESVKSPYFHIDGRWDTYYASRSSRFRKRMRNTLNRVARFGDILIEKIEEEKRLNESLSIICDVSTKSWKHDRGKSLPKRKNQLTFYNHITKSMGKKGWITIWFLTRHNKCLAFEYHLIYKGVVYPIRADFDEEYSAISPGSFLEYNIIKTLFHDPSVQEYDFCGDNYKYMLNWTQSIKEHVNVSIFNRRFLSKSLGWMECRLIPVVKKNIRIFVPAKIETKFCRQK